MVRVFRQRERLAELPAQGHEGHPAFEAALAAAAVDGQHAVFEPGHGQVAHFQGEAVGALEEDAAGHHHTAAEAGAGRDVEQAAHVIGAIHPLAEGRGVAVIGHENGFADLRRETAADVGAHPVVTEIGFPPDDSVGTRSRDVEADSGDGIDGNAGIGGEFRKRVGELGEGAPVAILHQTRHLHHFPDLFARGVDEHALDGGTSDIQAGEVGFHVTRRLSEGAGSGKFGIMPTAAGKWLSISRPPATSGACPGCCSPSPPRCCSGCMTISKRRHCGTTR